MAQASLLPLAATAIPVMVAAIIVATRRHPDLRDTVLAAGAVLTFAAIAAMVPAVMDGRVPTTVLGELVPGVELSLRADGMGMVFALLAGLLWILASVYAVGYLRGDGAQHQTRFYAFYALCLSTAFGVAFAGDLLTFFVFYELLTISTYPLVTHKGDAKAVAAGRTYLAYLIGGGILVLFGLGVVYVSVGDLAFAPGGFVGDAMGPVLTTIAFAAFAIGFGTKGGLMPLHAWLPAAMVAPTPVSALLHAVAVVKGGVFAFGRLLGFVFGPVVLAELTATTVLASAAAATIVIASVIALRQDHLKRRLAYSTIAHLAYIILGFSLLTADAFDGALRHIVNHGALKITLFFCAGALHVHLHKDHVSELDGVGRQMPFTMGAFAIGAIGLAGLPPAGGFVSKWFLVLGAYEAEAYVFAAVMAFGGLFTAGYLLPVVYRAFFRPPPSAEHEDHGVAGAQVPAAGGTATLVAPATPATAQRAPTRRDADRRMVVPLVATAVLGLLLGFGDLFGIYELTSAVAAAVTGGG